ncbi:MAG: peptide chain release factor N(5)-glutamine methyltransferase [Rhabdochlamydiaceae bacterium]|jgi:release factor glutamine methyltransferase
MKTVSDILKISTDFLSQKGIASPRRQVEELLSHILKIPRIELYMQFDRPLVEAELDQLRGYLKLRVQRMPWQYIIGHVQFLGCTISLSQDVLIPRHETEILADLILKELPSTPVTIWDICCGSGCIGIALKKKRPDCTVILSDISPKAVEIARQNAEKNSADVTIRQGDLCLPFRGEKADIIVCNPPYISEADYITLDPEVRDFEPKLALVGTDFYVRLAKELPTHLNPGSKAYFEIGTGMGAQLKELFVNADWSSVDVLKDWSSHDRFLKAVCAN